MPPLRIVQLTTDGRQLLNDFSSPKPALGTAPQALMQGFAVLPEVEVHVVSCLQQSVHSPAKLAENVWFHSLHVPKIGWLRTGYQGCVRTVRRKLRQLQPDVVHGQGTERDCAWCAVWSGYPNVVTLHGNMSEMARVFGARPGSFAWCAKVLENLTLRRTRGVFCNSQFTENLVRRRARTTWHVPNAVREEFFAPSRRPGSLSPPVLVNIGVITPNKRQLELVELADRLHARGLKFELRFLGHADTGDAYANQFLAAVKADARRSYVSYHGLKLDRELVDGYDHGTALVHFPKVETFGLVVAEALCRGLKVFAARTGGLVDIMQGVESAEHFASDDIAGLETAIARWLRDGALMPGQSAGAVMQERYHPVAVARRHLEIYREVLESPL